MRGGGGVTESRSTGLDGNERGGGVTESRSTGLDGNERGGDREQVNWAGWK